MIRHGPRPPRILVGCRGDDTAGTRSVEPPTDLFDPVPIDPSGVGGPTRSQAGRAGTPRSPWRRSSKAHYVPTYVDWHLPEQRIVEKAVLLPPGGAVTGWAGLRALGALLLRRPHR